VLNFDVVRLKRVMDLAGEIVRSGRSVGAAIAVSSSQELIHEAFFSQSDAPHVSSDSRFLIASLTKPILATAVMQLVERGWLSLAAPLSLYLPEFRGGWKDRVNTWHLLTHTSGLPEISWQVTLDALPDRAVSYEAACAAKLTFIPGTQVSYSTLSFYLLAELLTRLGGQPYQRVLGDHVLEPLEMRATGFDPPRHLIIPVKGMTAETKFDQQTATKAFMSFQMPGAGLWSTLPDLVKFGQAQLNGNHVLNSHTQSWMTRDHTVNLQNADGDTPHYGLAWRKRPLTGGWPGSPRAFEHDGATGSLLWIDPEYDLVVVYLAATFMADARDVQHVLNAVYGALTTL
jgi:serine-type D-Ala-D-Ala carboxypeptidase